MEPPGCAAHSEDCPACEADHTNLLPFTNNEPGQITRKTHGEMRLFLEQVQINQRQFCSFEESGSENAVFVPLVARKVHPVMHAALTFTVQHLRCDRYTCFYI